MNLLARVHVGNALHEQKAGLDFHLVALVLQFQQIRTTTYQWV